jgi:hypothetical protein
MESNLLEQQKKKKKKEGRRYLRASDVSGPIQLTIRTARLEPFTGPNGGTEYRVVLFFEETTQGLVLNKTNRLRFEEAIAPNRPPFYALGGTKIVLDIREFSIGGKKEKGFVVKGVTPSSAVSESGASWW